MDNGAVSQTDLTRSLFPSVAQATRSYLFTSPTVRIPVHAVHQSLAQKLALSDLWHFTFEIGAAQLRSVTEAVFGMVFVPAQEQYGIL